MATNSTTTKKGQKYGAWILYIVCISAALICVALTFWGNFKHGGVITVDAYVGVMATFIGICAAIVVGFQVYSYFEFRDLRNHLNDVDALKNKMEKINEDLAIEMHTTKKGVANAFRVFFRSDRQNPFASVMLVVAIITYDLKIIDADTSKFMRNRYRQLAALVKNDRYRPWLLKKYLDDLEGLEIPRCLDDYDEIMALHFAIIMKLRTPNSASANRL